MKNYKAAEAGITTMVVTMLTGPIIGLIPAAIENGGEIPDHHLQYPDGELMKNSSYRDCYTQKAQEVKRKEVWRCYGGGVVAQNLVGGLIAAITILAY